MVGILRRAAASWALATLVGRGRLPASTMIPRYAPCRRSWIKTRHAHSKRYNAAAQDRIGGADRQSGALGGPLSACRPRPIASSNWNRRPGRRLQGLKLTDPTTPIRCASILLSAYAENVYDPVGISAAVKSDGRGARRTKAADLLPISVCSSAEVFCNIVRTASDLAISSLTQAYRAEHHAGVCRGRAFLPPRVLSTALRAHGDYPQALALIRR